jgi:hypothetical protein
MSMDLSDDTLPATIATATTANNNNQDNNSNDTDMNIGGGTNDNIDEVQHGHGVNQRLNNVDNTNNNNNNNNNNNKNNKKNGYSNQMNRNNVTITSNVNSSGSSSNNHNNSSSNGFVNYSIGNGDGEASNRMNDIGVDLRIAQDQQQHYQPSLSLSLLSLPQVSMPSSMCLSIPSMMTTSHQPNEGISLNRSMEGLMIGYESKGNRSELVRLAGVAVQGIGRLVDAGTFAKQQLRL